MTPCPRRRHDFSPMPGFPSLNEHVLTRKARAQALVALPCEILTNALSAGGVKDAVKPFRRRADCRDAYDVVAFLHGFGVKGPTQGNWERLFGCDKRLRPEDIAVVMAFAAIGNYESRKHCARLADCELLCDVVFGVESDGVPGVLDMVCNKFDEWVLSCSALRGSLRHSAECVAHTWHLRPIAEGVYEWKRDGVTNGGVVVEHALGDTIGVCAGRIAVSETMGVVGRTLERVSLGGVPTAMMRLQTRADELMAVARGGAELVLVERVFECLAGSS